MNGILRYQAASIPLRLANAGAVIALPLLAVSAIGDVATGGLLVAALMLPSVVAAPIVGAVLDRVRRPRAVLVASGLISSAAYGVAAGLGVLPLPVIVLALVVSGVFTPVFTGGLSSFATDGIASARDAYTQDSLSYTVAGIGGPALVAVTAAVTSSARVSLVALAALALVGTVSSLRVVANPRKQPGENMGTTILNGLSYLVRHRPIAVVTTSGTISQIGGGALGVVAISLSIQRFGSTDAAAWIVTAFAVGGLGGAVAIAARRWTKRSAVWVMAMGFTATGACLLAVVPHTPIAFVLIVVGLAGVFTAPANAAMLLLRNQESKPSVRSQVFTIGAGLRSTAAALGAAVAGLAGGLDVAWLVAGMAVFWILSGGILVLYPKHDRSDAAETPSL